MQKKIVAGLILALTLTFTIAMAGPDSVTDKILTIEADGRQTKTSCDTNKFFIRIGNPPFWYYGNSKDDAGKHIFNLAMTAYVLGDTVTLGFDSTDVICTNSYRRINYISFK